MTKTTTNLPALAESHVKATEDKIRKLQENGELDLPQDYSAANALRSAYLILQETKDMNKRPALEVCTSASIANTLFDMIVQGFNPAKDQCYFIVYGNQLTCQPSYFGAEALTKRVDPTVADIVAEPVYVGDTLEYEIISGKKQITNHKQTIDSVEGSKIKAAYAMTIDHNGEVTKTVIMTIDEIKAAWKQSKIKPVDEKGDIKKGSTHEKFTGQMARRTVINRLCKDIVNTSSDKHLFQATTRASQIATEHEVQEEIDKNANQTPVDIEGEIVGDIKVEGDTIVDTDSPPVDITEITGKPSPEPPRESKTEKNTEASIKDKETPEPQGAAVSEKDGKEPDPFKDDLSETEREDIKIKEFREWLEGSKEQGVLKDAIDNMKKGYLKKFSPRVQEEVQKICEELTKPETEKSSGQKPDF